MAFLVAALDITLRGGILHILLGCTCEILVGSLRRTCRFDWAVHKTLLLTQLQGLLFENEKADSMTEKADFERKVMADLVALTVKH